MTSREHGFDPWVGSFLNVWIVVASLLMSWLLLAFRINLFSETWCGRLRDFTGGSRLGKPKFSRQYRRITLHLEVLSSSLFESYIFFFYVTLIKYRKRSFSRICSWLWNAGDWVLSVILPTFFVPWNLPCSVVRVIWTSHEAEGGLGPSNSHRGWWVNVPCPAGLSSSSRRVSPLQWNHRVVILLVLVSVISSNQ